MATKRALIVDDSKTAQHRLKKLLRGYGLHIVAVDSAEAALSYLSSSVPDVVFMDHLMPGMDGFRALQIIKSHPATATIPVIMYTSKSGDLYTSEARALGALDVVSKDTVDAADLRKVLKAIHIYEEDSPEAVAQTKTKPQAEAYEAPPVRMPSSTPLDSPEKTLSVELRLRELEHTIDDNRRIITSRLVREMQGVRYQVRKLVESVTELRQQSASQNQQAEDAEETNAPDARSNGGRFWATAASIALVAALSALLLWVPKINEKLDRMAAAQGDLSNHLTLLAEKTEQPPSLAPQPEVQNALALLPDLSWAFNQYSIQEFHADLITPELTQRLNELVARLASHDFKGTIRLKVSGGNFCVVTNLNGQPELPSQEAQLRDCMLVSELYGTEATEEMTERLETALAETAMLNNRGIQLAVEPLAGRFAYYPAFQSHTPAQGWNQVARQNNRILIQLEPASSRPTARRN